MTQQLMYHVGLTCIAMTFILSAIKTFPIWQDTIGMMQAKKIPQANVMLMLATLLKFIAGLMLLLNFQTTLAATGLLIFTVIATLIFANFWQAKGMERRMSFFHFLSNLSIVGGLLVVISN